jgi:hypothetical protein
VIHIRNIPNEVSEAEIIHLGIPFGRVTNVLVLKEQWSTFLPEAVVPSPEYYHFTCVVNPKFLGGSGFTII